MAKKVLVLDDDEGILEGFKAMLESEGYDVSTSTDPYHLQSIPASQYPDLILLDVLLSGEDGREVCKILKKHKSIRKIPLLMMSAALNMEQSVLEAGADGFLKKPFEMDEMLRIIDAHVNKVGKS